LTKEKSKSQQFKENYCILCEGTTEFNYFKGIKQKISDSNINIKIVDMKGGGYSNIVNEITKLGKVGYLAVFVIFDADKAENPSEKIQLEKLLNFCKKLNSNHSLFPCFLIINSPDFEYIACLHDSDYNGKDPAAHIEKVLGYGDLENFKSDKDIFKKLNSEPLSYQNMLKKIKNSQKIIWNDYTIEKSRKKIILSCIHSDLDSIGKKGSNINEVFDILKFNR